MKARLQEIYEYILGDRADIDSSVKTVPAPHQAAHKAKKIENIKRQFFEAKEPLIPENERYAFRIALRRLNAKSLEAVLFDNATDSLDKNYLFPDEKEIENQFQLFEKQHHFFEKKEYKDIIEKFTIFFKLCKLIADFVEHNNNENNQVAYQHAYKMLVIFGDQDDPKKYFSSFDNFLNLHNLREEKNPIHDVLVRSIPENNPTSPLHLPEWRQLIQQSGLRALRLFSRASEIEKQLRGSPPKNYQQACDIAKSVLFKNMAKDPELAELCMHYDVNEAVFEACLECKKSRKKSDNLPNTIVAGEDVDKPGYYLVKLPIEDPRAFILGHITNCCQSIGGHSECCVKDGLTLADNGFYILLKAKKKLSSHRGDKQSSVNSQPINKDGTINYTNFEIIGQGYAWLSQRGNLTFDSWENLRPAADDAVVIPMLERFAYEVTHVPNTSILRVTIGVGGKTPSQYSTLVRDPEKIKTGFEYGDSKKQKLIYFNEERCAELLNDLHHECQQLLKDVQAETKLDFLTKDHLTSVQQYNLFKQLLKNESVKYYLKQPGVLSEWIDIIKIHHELGHGERIWQAVESLTNIRTTNDFKEKMEELKRNLMCDAAAAGNVTIVNKLLQTKVDINAITAHGNTPLYWAKNAEIVRLLVESDANINTITPDSKTPLVSAIRLGNEDAAVAMIEIKANCTQKDSLGAIPLIPAAKDNRIQVLKKLIAVKVNVDEPDNFGQTAMTYAIYAGQLEVVNLLISAGANLNALDKFGHSLMDTAVSRGTSSGIVLALLDANVSLTEKTVSSMGNSHNDEMRAIYLFKDVSQNQFQWLMNQVNKILELKVERNPPINLIDLKKQLDDIFITSKQSHTLLMYRVCAMLYYTISNAKEDYEALSPTVKESKFASNPLESEIYQAIFSLLKMVNKELAWHPFKTKFFAKSSFKEPDFFDPLPHKIASSQEAKKL